MNRSDGVVRGGGVAGAADPPRRADTPGGRPATARRSGALPALMRQLENKDQVTLAGTYMDLLPWPGSKIECTPECAAEETD
ncbi:hypothetical protein RE9431_11390 [Prescottella equi]|nr:Uncharacterised protein [Prescottella equi]GBF14219.1 hypothetical protein Br6_01586 [Rhodococcus sp. Br-6]BCN42876.1 hypothetical protein RE9414_11560 [Prescottella equi]BCN62684.1 hypothetical protein RE9431_11390 [Prescottella equi]BCN72537.1 hypothetical protein RE0327_11360 [Prescottella equi]